MNFGNNGQDLKTHKAEILARLDIAAEYTALGVEFTQPGPNAKGWRECRARGREDRDPSAAVNLKSGHYKSYGEGAESLTFWDFAVKYGNFGDFQAVLRHFEAKVGLGRQPPPASTKSARTDDGAHAPKGRRGASTFKAAVAFEARRIAGKKVAQWIYRAADGEEWLWVVRFQVAGQKGKSYRPFHIDSTAGWVCGDPPGPLPLYRLPELLASDAPVWVGEGEKVADLIAGLGLVATTSAHGAGSARKTDWTPLAGRAVLLVPDHDQAGENYAREVLALLAELQPRPAVKVVRLPGLPEGGDIEQWLDTFPDRLDDAATRAELERLAGQAPPWDFDQAHAAANGKGNGSGDDHDYESLSDEDLGIIGAETIKPERVEWEWQDRIARGKFNLLAGEGGDGKSLVAIALVASITTGGLLPDGSGPVPIGSCFILAAEDGARDTIVPRLIAAGADLSRVKILTAQLKTRGKDGKPLIHPMSFQNLPYWRAVFGRRPDGRLLVADPIPAYLGRGVNDHRNAEVRAVLEPFGFLLDELQIAMIGITHLGKSPDLRTPAHKILGSVAYSNLARTVHVTVHDPEAKGRRFLSQSKNNYGELQPALAFRVVAHTFLRDEVEIKTSRTAFEPGTVDIDAAELLSANRSPKRRGPAPVKTATLAEWLHDFLADHGRAVPLGAIFDAAGEAGHLGKRKDDGKWSAPAPLYRARNLVSTLPAPRDGKRVEEFKTPVREGGRDVPHWYLVGGAAAF